MDLNDLQATGMSRECRSGPILTPQSLDAPELAEIPSDDDQPATASMPRDKHVVAADRQTLPLKRCPDFGGVPSRIRVKHQHFKPCGEVLDLAPVVIGSRGLRGANAQVRSAR